MNSASFQWSLISEDMTWSKGTVLQPVKAGGLFIAVDFTGVNTNHLSKLVSHDILLSKTGTRMFTGVQAPDEVRAD
jgi:hypothetical protein